MAGMVNGPVANFFSMQDLFYSSKGFGMGSVGLSNSPDISADKFISVFEEMTAALGQNIIPAAVLFVDEKDVFRRKERIVAFPAGSFEKGWFRLRCPERRPIVLHFE